MGSVVKGGLAEERWGSVVKGGLAGERWGKVVKGGLAGERWGKIVKGGLAVVPLQSPNETAKGDVEHEGEKYPLPVSQGLPYFVSLDKEMERMAFDPAVKPSDRHNAKERHRRVRITKAADFFRDSVPCMNANMDKATVFHLTVYYLTYIRNSLQQEDPSLLSNLHKSYRQEWEKYFNMQQMLDEPCM
ncbi:predicted protein [Nematostella vectensis]|uniref:BHLH domain-containing protein n=1 Tax=Nematostella vectensis TaxID=45351 RepID=A7T321_NEMVE|nr:predicted protein [Nematostella vectensis]|eukprot:XP_001621744.1 hypothetical protein NEMVEDRAFT_v1g248644 [Nematostella vectensis]